MNFNEISVFFFPGNDYELVSDRIRVDFMAVATYARSQGRTPISFGPTDLVCCRNLQGHTGKVEFFLSFSTLEFHLLKFAV